MDVEKIKRRALFSWVSMGVLAALVCILALLQYQWIGELSEAERKKLQESLQAGLGEVSRDFNQELNAACAALTPTGEQVDQMGRKGAYEARYAQWKESTTHAQIFERIPSETPGQEYICSFKCAAHPRVVKSNIHLAG